MYLWSSPICGTSKNICRILLFCGLVIDNFVVGTPLCIRFDNEARETFARSTIHSSIESWWRHQVETFSALLALCEGNPSVNGEFPSQRPMTRSFDVFFDVRLNKRLSKQFTCQWFKTPRRSLWHLCYGVSLSNRKLSCFLAIITHILSWNLIEIAPVCWIWYIFGDIFFYFIICSEGGGCCCHVAMIVTQCLCDVTQHEYVYLDVTQCLNALWTCINKIESHKGLFTTWSTPL